MAIRSLMVILGVGRSNESLLTLVGDLAERLDASVVGIAACQLVPSIYSDGYVSSELVDGAQRAAQDDMDRAEAAFRGVLEKRHCSIDWRSCIAIEGPAAYVACQARCADLIVTGGTTNTGLGVNIGDLIMESGRPILSIPGGVSTLTFKHAIVAWKDTREARLAIAAALPLLKIASRVSIIEIADPGNMESARRHVQDVAHWLARHGIHAGPTAVAAEDDPSRALGEIAKTQGADLIVAGAYGHSRLREWVLGGFTRHLLSDAGLCALVMH